MTKDGIQNLIKCHGTAIDKENRKVRCNYCGKEVNGFSRLQNHLAAVGSDVIACEGVPADVKVHLKNAILEIRKEKLMKEVGELYHPDLPLRRNFTPKNPANESLLSSVKPKKPTNTEIRKNMKNVPVRPCSSFKRIHNAESLALNCNIRKPANALNKGKKPVSPCPTATNSTMHTGLNSDLGEKLLEETLSNASKSIAQFVYETGLDHTIVKHPSFRKMLETTSGCQGRAKLPRVDELGGWLLQEKMKEVQKHVEEIKVTWVQTGCSIILDGWTDARHRDLICFFVNSLQGTVFLKSVDVSVVMHDDDALFSLLHEVVKEVGLKNVVQIVSNETTSYIETAGKKLEKHLSLFWSLGAPCCIDLILEKTGKMDNVKEVLEKVEYITKFIYSHPLPLQLMRNYINKKDIARSSNLKSVARFITLENLVTERVNLVNMFSSFEWNSSVWASRGKGKFVADIIKDPSFWAAADVVLKASIPIVSMLRRSDGKDKTNLGCIYDSMDQAKELIRSGLGNEKEKVTSIWHIIDEIWNGHLHNPLHSAGYYLNPNLFYSSDFFVDAEVANGLMICIVRMVEDQQEQDLIVLQLDAYRTGTGRFSEKEAIDQRMKISPTLWWSLYGGETPELQRFAIRILSQNCRGDLPIGFARNLSEELHARERNPIEHERLQNIEFVHYNLRLWHSPMSGKDPADDILLDDVDPTDISIVDSDV